MSAEAGRAGRVFGIFGWGDAGTGDGEERVGLVVGILGGGRASYSWSSPDLVPKSGVVCAGIVAGISGGVAPVAVAFSNVGVRDGR